MVDTITTGKDNETGRWGETKTWRETEADRWQDVRISCTAVAVRNFSSGLGELLLIQKDTGKYII